MGAHPAGSQAASKSKPVVLKLQASCSSDAESRATLQTLRFTLRRAAGGPARLACAAAACPCAAAAGLHRRAALCCPQQLLTAQHPTLTVAAPKHPTSPSNQPPCVPPPTAVPLPAPQYVGSREGKLFIAAPRLALCVAFALMFWGVYCKFQQDPSYLLRDNRLQWVSTPLAALCVAALLGTAALLSVRLARVRAEGRTWTTSQRLSVAATALSLTVQLANASFWLANMAYTWANRCSWFQTAGAAARLLRRRRQQSLR